MTRLADLFPDLTGVPAVCVGGVSLDSRAVRPNDLFLALSGSSHDGHRFVADAAAAGAVAVAGERPIDGCALPQITVPDLARRVSALAGALYGHPSAGLQTVAVTGTNGKTSVAYFCAWLARLLGRSAGFLGTVGWGRLEPERSLASANLTTADAVTLQARLRRLADDGVDFVALELSSHALAQHRADALTVDVAVFTNLSHDHLDYHRTMAAYGAAKARLFEFAGLRHAVLNTDDAFGQQLKARLRGQLALSEVTLGRAATLRAVRAAPAGLSWELRIDHQWHPVQAPLFGTHNAENLSAAILALHALGYDAADLVSAASSVRPPPGRLQAVSGPAGTPAVFVDYAHTPHALETVLAALRPHVAGRLICVFGCGGDRDPAKRGPMGRAVLAGADAAWLTTDNPRGEAPEAILQDVLDGLTDTTALVVNVDRAAAITGAIDAAGAHDLVLIAGKGHETYQEVDGVRLPFDDAAVAATALHNRKAR